MGNSSILGPGAWGGSVAKGPVLQTLGNKNTNEAEDREVENATNLSKAWEISLQSERDREEHQQ